MIEWVSETDINVYYSVWLSLLNFSFIFPYRWHKIQIDEILDDDNLEQLEDLWMALYWNAG